VKYLEAAGAQIIPIKYDLDEEQLRKIFNNINGLFFPGGGADLLKSQI
jgi:gamma-glutamyl hydrolase